MQSAFFSSFEITTSPLLDCCCRLAVSCILGMLIGIEDVPHLILARAAVALSCHLIVRMHLYG